MPCRRNVIQVTVDSLRADHCGFMDDGGDLTPTLDRLARDGLVYENAIASAGSTPGSTASFLTGRYPHNRPTASSSHEAIQQHFRTEDTLPERLSRRGYEAAVFTANPWTSRYYLDESLFDHFEDYIDGDQIVDGGRTSGFGIGSMVSRAVNWWRGQSMFMTWEAMYDEIKAWLDEAPEPYYCWIFLVDPHMPYLPPRDYRTQPQFLCYLANAFLFANKPDAFGGLFDGVLTEAYRNTVRYADAFVDRLLTDLDGDLLLFVHADHGELFGEGGEYGHGSVREEILHVPFVMAGRPSSCVDEPFSLCSLPDLVVDAAANGTLKPGDYTSPYVRARLRGPERVLRGRDWKFVRRGGGEQLYRVDDGGCRTIDVPELRAAASQVVDAWLEEDRERCAVMQGAHKFAAGQSL